MQPRDHGAGGCAGARCQGLPLAPLEYARAQPIAPEDLRQLDVDALREQRMGLERLRDLGQRVAAGILVDQDYRVRVAERQRGEFYAAARKLQGEVDQAVRAARVLGVGG